MIVLIDQLAYSATGQPTFPYSAAAKGQKDEKEKANVEQVAMANLLKGVHW